MMKYDDISTGDMLYIYSNRYKGYLKVRITSKSGSDTGYITYRVSGLGDKGTDHYTRFLLSLPFKI